MYKFDVEMSKDDFLRVLGALKAAESSAVERGDYVLSDTMLKLHSKLLRQVSEFVEVVD